MPKFSKDDKIRVSDSSTGRVGIVTDVEEGRYQILWNGDSLHSMYPHGLIDSACELTENLGENNPNVLFKKNRG